MLDKWERSWLAHWAKAGTTGYELPKTGNAGAEAAFLTEIRTPEKETRRLERIHKEFVRGFRELFAAGEGERQEFLEQKGIFSRYLPYAIVFGMADQWARRFQALGLSNEDLGVGGWYISQ